MADALATETLAPLAADGLPLLGAALVLLGGPVVLLRALTLGSQPAGPTAAHSALKGPIAVVAVLAVRLRRGLAGTVTVEGDLDDEVVLKAHRLDGEGLFLLLGAATHLGLNAEAHLDGKSDRTQVQVDPVNTPALEISCSLPGRGTPKVGVWGSSACHYPGLQSKNKGPE